MIIDLRINYDTEAIKHIVLILYVMSVSISFALDDKVKSLKKDCNGGNASAYYNLGVMYVKGEGVKQDKSKAKKLFGCV